MTKSTLNNAAELRHMSNPIPINISTWQIRNANISNQLDDSTQFDPGIMDSCLTQSSISPSSYSLSPTSFQHQQQQQQQLQQLAPQQQQQQQQQVNNDGSQTIQLQPVIYLNAPSLQQQGNSSSGLVDYNLAPSNAAAVSNQPFYTHQSEPLNIVDYRHQQQLQQQQTASDPSGAELNSSSIDLESLLVNTRLSDNFILTSNELAAAEAAAAAAQMSQHEQQQQQQQQSEEDIVTSNNINPMFLFKSNHIDFNNNNNKSKSKYAQQQRINKIDEEEDLVGPMFTRNLPFANQHQSSSSSSQMASSLPTSYLSSRFNQYQSTAATTTTTSTASSFLMDQQPTDPVLTQLVLNSNNSVQGHNINNNNNAPTTNMPIASMSHFQPQQQQQQPQQFYYINQQQSQPQQMQQQQQQQPSYGGMNYASSQQQQHQQPSNNSIYSSSLPANYYNLQQQQQQHHASSVNYQIKRSSSPVTTTTPNSNPSHNLTSLNGGIQIKSELMDPILDRSSLSRPGDESDESKFAKLKLSSPISNVTSPSPSNALDTAALNSIIFDIDDLNEQLSQQQQQQQQQQTANAAQQSHDVNILANKLKTEVISGSASGMDDEMMMLMGRRRRGNGDEDELDEEDTDEDEEDSDEDEEDSDEDTDEEDEDEEDGDEEEDNDLDYIESDSKQKLNALMQTVDGANARPFMFVKNKTGGGNKRASGDKRAHHNMIVGSLGSAAHKQALANSRTSTALNSRKHARVTNALSGADVHHTSNSKLNQQPQLSSSAQQNSAAHIYTQSESKSLFSNLQFSPFTTAGSYQPQLQQQPQQQLPAQTRQQQQQQFQPQIFLSTSLPPINNIDSLMSQSAPTRPSSKAATSKRIKAPAKPQTKKRQKKKQELFEDDFDDEDDDDDGDLDDDDDDDDDDEDGLDDDDDDENYQDEENSDCGMDASDSKQRSKARIVKVKKNSGGGRSRKQQSAVAGSVGSNTSAHTNSDSLFDLMMSSKNRDIYFWQYNIQSKGPKTKKVLTLRNKDPHLHRDFFDPVFQLQSLNSRGGSSLNKLRKGDGNDVTPNAEKLYNLGNQIREFIQKSFQINSGCFSQAPATPNPTMTMTTTTATASSNISSSLGVLGAAGSGNSILSASLDNAGGGTAVPRERVNLKREKNKIASRACRLKKKAQHEANKIKLFGLNEEHKQLIECINVIRDLIRKKLTEPNLVPKDKKMIDLVEELVKQKLRTRVAGNTDGYVHLLMLAVEKQKTLNGGGRAEGGSGRGKAGSHSIDLNQFNAQYSELDEQQQLSNHSFVSQ